MLLKAKFGVNQNTSVSLLLYLIEEPPKSDSVGVFEHKKAKEK